MKHLNLELEIALKKNYESRGKYNEPNQVKFKISMLIPFK